MRNRLLGKTCAALLGVASLVLTSGSCKSKGENTPEAEPAVPVQAAIAKIDAGASADPVAPADPADLASFAQAINELGLDIYRLQAKEPGNIVFSPASIAVAFAMTYAGSAGSTADEMRSVLHLSPTGRVDAAAGALLKGWNEVVPGQELRVVNQLFGEASYVFEGRYLQKLEAMYSAPLERLDFKGQPDAQRAHINEWVGKQTKERITELLPAGSILPDTRLVLVNAIYFLGHWAQSFDAEATTAQSFLVAGTTSKKVATMAQTEEFAYAQAEGCKLLELPYGDSPLVMTLVLPDAPSGLAALESRLSSETFAQWLTLLKTENVSVRLPRFELKKSRLKLVELLKALGMKAAFDQELANFSGMARPASSDDDLYISSAFHEAFIKVDEVGTEAAAATAVVMSVKGGRPAAPKEFFAQHPFLFAIRDTRSGAIVFMGRVTDPS